MPRLCAPHASPMCSTCLAYVLHMPRLCAPHASPMCSTCLACVLHMPRLCAPHASPVCSTCLACVLHMPRLCAPHASPMCSTCLAYVLHMPRLCAPHASPMCSTRTEAFTFAPMGVTAFKIAVEIALIPTCVHPYNSQTVPCRSGLLASPLVLPRLRSPIALLNAS